MCRKRVVMDTGAGPNCVKKYELPPGSEKFVRSSPNLRLLGPVGKPLAIHSIVTFSVHVRSQIEIHCF